MVGVDPKVWGASAWTLIHTTAFSVVNDHAMRMAKHIYYSFLHVLPCDKCRKNYDMHLVNLPIPYDKHELGKWSYMLHSRISESDITYRQAKQKWEHHVLTVDDILPLLESIAVTHPGAHRVDAIYRDNLYNLLVSIAFFLKLPSPPIPIERVSSRQAYKAWLRRVKTKHGNSRHLIQKCDQVCHVTG